MPNKDAAANPSVKPTFLSRQKKRRGEDPFRPNVHLHFPSASCAAPGEARRAGFTARAGSSLHQLDGCQLWQSKVVVTGERQRDPELPPNIECSDVDDLDERGALVARIRPVPLLQ